MKEVAQALKHVGVVFSCQVPTHDLHWVSVRQPDRPVLHLAVPDVRLAGRGGLDNLHIKNGYTDTHPFRSRSQVVNPAQKVCYKLLRPFSPAALYHIGKY